MRRYVEASPRARQWFFLIAVVWAGLGFIASRLNTYLPLSGHVEELLIQIDARALCALVVLSLFYVALSVVAIVLAARTVRTGQWPPVGLKVPFRTPVTEIRKPYKVWLLLGLLLAVYAGHVALAACTAAATHSQVQEVQRLVGPKP
jgi:hypothetical protein